MEKVLIGMSGGVDSSAAAVVLQKGGHEVVGVTLALCEKSDEAAVADAAAVCKTLGIEHLVRDYRAEFQKAVIDNFIAEYLAGRTPNPCILCNEKIKFGLMAELAKSTGCTAVATGHYAVTQTQSDGRVLLCRPKDRHKDQTYMLCRLNQEQLKMARFPLADLTKAEVRALAQEIGLSVADRADSQDICFVPSGDYASFIEERVGRQPTGDFRDPNGNLLGTHQGLIRYTVGQRKGLGIALGKPAFVLEKNVDGNFVVLGDEEALFYRRVLVENINYIPFDTLKEPLKVGAKLRYRQTEQPALLHPVGERAAILEFEEPQRAPSPGQTAVFYDGEVVVGGGTIEKGES